MAVCETCWNSAAQKALLTGDAQEYHYALLIEKADPGHDHCLHPAYGWDDYENAMVCTRCGQKRRIRDGEGSQK